MTYLWCSRYLSICYQGELDPSTYGVTVFDSFADASFGNNLDRKSAQGFVITLFNGLIDWKSSKQSTVTKSTTEAELIALSAAAKDVIWWKHLFSKLQFDPGHGFTVRNDNLQAVRILTKENPQIQTKLRHKYPSTLAPRGN